MDYWGSRNDRGFKKWPGVTGMAAMDEGPRNGRIDRGVPGMDGMAEGGRNGRDSREIAGSPRNGGGVPGMAGGDRNDMGRRNDRRSWEGPKWQRLPRMTASVRGCQPHSAIELMSVVYPYDDDGFFYIYVSMLLFFCSFSLQKVSRSAFVFSSHLLKFPFPPVFVQPENVLKKRKWICFFFDGVWALC